MHSYRVPSKADTYVLHSWYNSSNNFRMEPHVGSHGNQIGYPYVR